MQVLSQHETRAIGGGAFLGGLGVLAISGAELYYGFDTLSGRYQAGKLFLGAAGVGLVLSLGGVSDALKAGCAFLTIELARNDRLKLHFVKDYINKLALKVVSVGLKSTDAIELGQSSV